MVDNSAGLSPVGANSVGQLLVSANYVGLSLVSANSAGLSPVGANSVCLSLVSATGDGLLFSGTAHFNNAAHFLVLQCIVLQPCCILV